MRTMGWMAAAAAALVAAAGCATTGRQGAGNAARGILSGTVIEERSGKPVAGGFVYAYRELRSNLIGPSDYISGETNVEGRYTLQLLPGEYYVVARKRVSGDNTGPLSTGDLYSAHSTTPVTVSGGGVVVVNLKLLERDEPMFFKQNRLRVTDTGVKGVLVDEAGQPVVGAFAMAYTTSDLKRLPEFASTITASDGSFTLYLPRGGTYFLSARTAVRERPRKGELYGTYDGTANHSVVVKDRSFTPGIRIVLTSFPGSTLTGRPY